MARSPSTDSPTPNLPLLPATPKTPTQSVAGLDVEALPALTPLKQRTEMEKVWPRSSLDTTRSSVKGSSNWDGSGELSSESTRASHYSRSEISSHLRVDVEGQSFFFATPPTGRSSSPERKWVTPLPDGSARSVDALNAEPEPRKGKRQTYEHVRSERHDDETVQSLSRR